MARTGIPRARSNSDTRRPVLIVELHRTGGVEHLEILERVLIDEHHVGEQAGTDDAEVNGLAFRFVQRQRAVQRRRAHDLERMESCFLQHFQLEDVAEPVGLVDEP